MKTLSIIIVNYNVCYFLEQLLLSVQKALSQIDAEVIVVDNNSVDRSVEMIATRFPEVILIENKFNSGFSKANNQGLKIARGKYVLLLNPDTVVEENTFTKCIEFMDTHEDAGGLGVMMLDGKGNFLPESKRGLPTPWVAFCKISGLSALFPRSKKFGKYHLGFLDKDKTHEVDILSGAFLFIRSTALQKIGLLDESFFMYGEDIDLSYRIKQSGFKNYYFPETRIIHYKGESTKKSSLNYIYVFYKAMVIFARKHLTNRNAFLFSFLIHIAIYVHAFFIVVINFFKKITLPILDFSTIYIGIYFLKEYYEENFKKNNHFPEEFISIVVPIYIITWIASSYLSGAYDKSATYSKIGRGIFFGTIVISAVSNFFDVYRYSKALILAGAVWAVFAMIVIRILNQWRLHGNIALGETRSKKVIIVGDKEESSRVFQMLKGNTYGLDLLGYVSIKDFKIIDDHHLGNIDQLKDILDIYKIDEVIFCSKDFSANNIINCMLEIGNPALEYKILPDDGNYIIGSNSKNSVGEFYTLQLDLNIVKKSARRNKRVVDIAISILFLIVSPVLTIFLHRKNKFFYNLWNVIIGKFSWVGYSDLITVALPKLKKGITNPLAANPIKVTDQQTIDRINMLYAKNYKAFDDVNIIFRSLKQLG